MKEGAVASIETAKRSDTAELRKRFDSITVLLADGYNHKQICEHLNTLGLAIPYPQYRAIMTRLRREKAQSNITITQPTQQVRSPNLTVTLESREVPPSQLSEAGQQNEQGKKILWDPRSEVKWK